MTAKLLRTDQELEASEMDDDESWDVVADGMGSARSVAYKNVSYIKMKTMHVRWRASGARSQ